MYDKLTRTDIRKMEEEIEYRKLVVRPKALEDVKEARSHGDLSEISSITLLREQRIRMKAVFDTWTV